MGKWVHRLTDVDLEAGTATCAVDGPVQIYISGGQRRCGVAVRGRRDHFVKPVIRPGQHRMLSKDVEAGTGVCAICGEVRLIWRKNGYRCENSRHKPEQLRMKTELRRLLKAGKTCEICGGPGEVLDHKHGTKTWRGVLCHKHNSGLGMFDDDPALFQAAINYLQKHE